ncbi:MAG: hypothetical protein ABI691_23895 [Ginsengibacter sp.]
MLLHKPAKPKLLHYKINTLLPLQNPPFLAPPLLIPYYLQAYTLLTAATCLQQTSRKVAGR